MIGRDFFARSVHAVAPDLIGATFLCDGVGGVVVTLKWSVPFLISLPAMSCVPLTPTAGCWPPGRCSPVPGFTQPAVGVPVAKMRILTSPLPRPAMSPVAVRVVPLSVNVGLPFLKCGLAASAAVAVMPMRSNTVRPINIRRISVPPQKMVGVGRTRAVSSALAAQGTNFTFPVDTSLRRR